MKSRKIMPSNDQGLTVGELTIAISVLIIAGLIYSVTIQIQVHL